MRILIGVTGCIAAYKACEVIRGFQKAGHEVSVVLTESAKEFVGEATFRALADGRVCSSLFADEDPIPHIALAREADAFLIAPCTANVAAKIAHGIADDLLTSTALACTCPFIVAPAMNVHMYDSAATQENLRTLEERGAFLIRPEEGYLACGDNGRGRFPDPEAVVQMTLEHMAEDLPLVGKRILITSGPTLEPVDEVRFISNRSSGKMGACLVQAALDAGAEVEIVSGPVPLSYDGRAKIRFVETAQEMMEAAKEAFPESDIAICAAAVSDMRPARAHEGKLKKGRDDDALGAIELVQNPDILSGLCQMKRAGQVVVGFAAETEDVVEQAREKLARKGADMILANLVGQGRGFGRDESEAWIVTEEGVTELGCRSKKEIAKAILELLSLNRAVEGDRA